MRPVSRIRVAVGLLGLCVTIVGCDEEPIKDCQCGPPQEEVRELLQVEQNPTSSAGDSGQAVTGTILALSPTEVRLEIEGAGVVEFELIEETP